MNTMTDYQREIVSKIRKLRESKGISQKQLAIELGISTGQMGNIESISHPHKYTLKQIKEICDLFNMQVKDIFLEDEDYESDVIESLINKIIKYETKK